MEKKPDKMIDFPVRGGRRSTPFIRTNLVSLFKMVEALQEEVKELKKQLKELRSSRTKAIKKD